MKSNENCFLKVKVASEALKFHPEIDRLLCKRLRQYEQFFVVYLSLVRLSSRCMQHRVSLLEQSCPIASLISLIAASERNRMNNARHMEMCGVLRERRTATRRGRCKLHAHSSRETHKNQNYSKLPVTNVSFISRSASQIRTQPLKPLAPQRLWMQYCIRSRERPHFHFVSHFGILIRMSLVFGRKYAYLSEPLCRHASGKCVTYFNFSIQLRATRVDRRGSQSMAKSEEREINKCDNVINLHT